METQTTKRKRVYGVFGMRFRKVLKERAKSRKEKSKSSGKKKNPRVRQIKKKPMFILKSCALRKRVCFLDYCITHKLFNNSFVILKIELCGDEIREFYNITAIMKYLNSCGFTSLGKIDFRYFVDIPGRYGLKNLFFLMPQGASLRKCMLSRETACEFIPLGKDLGYTKIQLPRSETLNVVVARSEFTDSLSKKVRI